MSFSDVIFSTPPALSDIENILDCVSHIRINIELFSLIKLKEDPSFKCLQSPHLGLLHFVTKFCFIFI